MRVGFVNGCFDLLHEGHLYFLREARKHCDRLIVAINSDQSVKRLKGESRPIQADILRRANLLRTRLAETIIGFDTEAELGEYIKYFKPHCLIKGGEYREKYITGKDYIEQAGGEIIFINRQGPHSTSKLVNDTYTQR